MAHVLRERTCSRFFFAGNALVAITVTRAAVHNIGVVYHINYMSECGFTLREWYIARRERTALTPGICIGMRGVCISKKRSCPPLRHQNRLFSAMYASASIFLSRSLSLFRLRKYVNVFLIESNQSDSYRSYAVSCLFVLEQRRCHSEHYLSVDVLRKRTYRNIKMRQFSEKSKSEYREFESSIKIMLKRMVISRYL